jgi:hypothetical protein
VGKEWLDNESVKGTGSALYELSLAGLLLDPLSSDLPLLVEAKETGLSSTLDELIGLTDELVGEDPGGETHTRLNRWLKGLRRGIPETVSGPSIFLCHENSPLDLGNTNGGNGRLGETRDRDRGAGKPVGKQLFGIVFADSYGLLA